MKETAISVTEAARNFADCVNRAHYQGARFVLLKNGRPLARLIPASDKSGTGRDLAKALESAELPAEEARAWHKDLVTARKGLKKQAHKWQ